MRRYRRYIGDILRNAEIYKTIGRNATGEVGGKFRNLKVAQGHTWLHAFDIRKTPNYIQVIRKLSYMRHFRGIDIEQI